MNAEKSGGQNLLGGVLALLTYNVKRNPSALFISVVIFELLASFAIIEVISYTEIDWIAYMQEVGGFLGGDYNYANLRGDTGPLVYPAGFVYIYSILYYVTDQGTNIYLAQFIFLFLHAIFAVVFVLLLYKNTSKVLPLWVVVLTLLSRRIHSIFVLRLFNDCWAVFFCYLALLLLSFNKITKDNMGRVDSSKSTIYWYLGSILYSFAVSIKMNILLYAPAIGMLYYKYLGLVGTVKQVGTCVLVQLVVGLPFLLRYPKNYIQNAFNIGKDFEYKWTVNFKFIDEELFLNKKFGFILLLMMLLVLINVAQNVWCDKEQGLISFLMRYWKAPDDTLLELDGKDGKDGKKNREEVKAVMKRLVVNEEYFLDRLFLCNFIGIVFAKSLHFQFYVWYYHTVPYMTWRSSLPLPFKIALVAGLELIWNIFPSRPLTSAALWFIHLVLLTAVIKYQSQVYSRNSQKLKLK